MLSEGLLTHSKCLSLFQLEYLIEPVFGNQSRASQHICLLQPKTKEKKKKNKSAQASQISQIDESTLTAARSRLHNDTCFSTPGYLCLAVLQSLR